MLWTCIHLPDLCLQLSARAAAVTELLVITSGGQHPEVVACDEAARQRGIRPGMSVSAALALAPGLIERPHDLRAQAQALRNLALWASKFTPNVSLQAPDALLLELEGCLKLFGGLRTLVTTIQKELEVLGYRGILASAPTPTAASLFARAGISTSIKDRHALKRALAPLPLVLLNTSPVVVSKLTQAGVRTLGEAWKLPRDALGRRFGQALLDEMDRALAKLPDPRESFISPARYQSRLLLPAPVIESEALLFALKRLVLELCGFLQSRASGITRLKVDLQHADRPPSDFSLGLSLPSREATRIMQLLRERMHTLALRDPVEAITLHAQEICALAPRNLTLFPDERTQEEGRLMLIEHLRARLGVEKVYTVTTFADHRPEHAFRHQAPGQATNQTSPAQRPLWLLHQPRPISQQGAQLFYGGALILDAGPERIESGWWDGQDIRRDYFVARNAAGQTLWIFRDRGATRRWYVHGLFA